MVVLLTIKWVNIEKKNGGVYQGIKKKLIDSTVFLIREWIGTLPKIWQFKKIIAR